MKSKSRTFIHSNPGIWCNASATAIIKKFATINKINGFPIPYAVLKNPPMKIALKHAKSTDRLYLLTKENINNMGKVNIKDTKEVESKLMQHATRIIER